jgi:hypothetical protein
VPGLAEQTVHEDEFAHGPTNCLDDLLGDAVVVIQQGHMRCVLRLRPTPEPGFFQRHAKQLLKRYECRDTIAPAQDEWPVTRSARETHRAVECDVKPRHYNGRRGFTRRADDTLRQSHVTEMMQRDMEALRRERPTFQSMFTAQSLCDLCDARGSVGVR